MARLVPAPGTEGWLCRLPGAVVWLPAASPDADELISACLAAASPSELLGRVGARLADPEAAPWPPFAILAVRGPDLVAVVHGPVEVEVDQEGRPETLRGGDDVGSWLHRVLHGATSLRAGLPAGDEGLSDLRDGVVRASGFALVNRALAGNAPYQGGGAVAGRRGPSPERGSPDRRAVPVPEDLTVAEEPVVLTGPEEGRDVHLRSAFDFDHAPTIAAGRPLGKLTWDNGDVHELAGAVLIGRDVDNADEVMAGNLVPLVPTGQNDSMSRVHAEVRPQGAEIVVLDRGSTNGTFIWDEASRAWQRLPVGEPHPLANGTVIAFGERTATFEGVTARVR
jgi:hypothetical protein